MKAEELRIGNIIKSGTVDGIHPNGVIEVINNNGAREFLHHLALEHPVKLTEEWLLRVGFDLFNKNEAKFNFSGFEIYWDGEGFFLESIGIELHYVHQLQNLYFALTREELSVKSEED